MKPFFAALLLVFEALSVTGQQKTTGRIIVINPELHQLIDTTFKAEVLGDGFLWSEGPVWVKEGNYLLFSDVKKNTVYKFKENEGITEFLRPSGYTGVLPYSDEPGSNGLIINRKGELVSCEHGDRRLSVMPLNKGGKRTLADNYSGHYFNSPNDVVQKSNGDYYFTDPAYGLPADSARQGRRMGVYRISVSGKVDLLAEGLTPNGLAFSPDEKILYVAQSLPDKAIIYSFNVNSNGLLTGKKIFYDATELVKRGLKGLPDGLKVDVKGNLFATGPGGVLVINPKGILLGRIDTDQPTANVAWGDDGSTLYITANMLLCRVKTKTRGTGWR